MGFWRRLFPEAKADPEVRPVLLTKLQRTALAQLCHRQYVVEKNRRELNSPFPQFYLALQRKLLDAAV